MSLHENSSDTSVPTVGEDFLLSPEASRSAARPLRHWSIADRERLRARIEAFLAGWLVEWRPDRQRQPGSALQVSCNAVEVGGSADEADAAESWSPWAPARLAGLWFRFPREGVARRSSRAFCLDTLYGERDLEMPGATGPRLVDEMADLAWSDLVTVLSGALEPSSGKPGGTGGQTASAGNREAIHAASRAWSGALNCRIQLGGRVLELMLDGDAVQGALHEDGRAERSGRAPSATPRLQPPVPLLTAVDHTSVSLSVDLDGFDLGLGTLATLAVGDVLCTVHELSMPLNVRVAVDGQASVPLCDGFLGREDTHLAVQLSTPSGTADFGPSFS